MFQWLQEWETIMIECIKYDLSEVQNSHWLQNLVQQIRSVSEIYNMQFTKNASNKIKSNLKKFWKMTKELHEMLETQKNECIMWENAFHADFDESSEEDSDVKSIQETEQALSRNRKKSKKIKKNQKFNLMRSKSWRKQLLNAQLAVWENTVFHNVDVFLRN